MTGVIILRLLLNFISKDAPNPDFFVVDKSLMNPILSSPSPNELNSTKVQMYAPKSRINFKYEQPENPHPTELLNLFFGTPIAGDLQDFNSQFK